MPFDAQEELLNYGRRYAPDLFPPPMPPQPYTGYQWSPTRYLMSDPHHSRMRYYVEAILAYCGYAADVSQLEPFGRLIGAYQWGLKTYLSPFTPNFAWFKMPQVKYVAFAGTTNWLQWIRNVIGATTVAAQEPIQGNIATTWNVAAKAVHADVVSVVGPTVRDEWFVLAGHSLGAAVAEVVSRNLFQFHNWAPRRVVTFGGPRVGDGTWGKGGFPPLLRCVNEGDPVTQVPPSAGVVTGVLLGLPGQLTGLSSFLHTKSERTQVGFRGVLSSAGNDRSGADSVASAAWAALIGDNPPSPHRLKEYITRLNTNLFTDKNPYNPWIQAFSEAHVALRKQLNDYP